MILLDMVIRYILIKFVKAGSGSRVVDNSAIHTTRNPPARRQSMTVHPICRNDGVRCLYTSFLFTLRI
jgi:hypothetical protein